MYISYTSEITNDDVATLWDPAGPNRDSDIWNDDSLEGGYIQFLLADSYITSNERWIPFGTIENMKDQSSELQDRFETADDSTPDDEFTDSDCSKDIYR
ncbi:hypothetical protein BRC64_06645 [Halobacteriales archaeon QH_10_67_22]|nr:MAG: hypothetical protein BRC64_06645 [Halobacteriales archaeon QH_10_67_22]